MKLTTFLLAILLPVLLIAACHDEAGAKCGEDAPGGPYELGGPYPKGGDFADGVLEGKQNEFSGYKALGLSFSHAVELPDPEGNTTFEDSIQANLDGSGQQRYNYAITADCKIFMAAWSASDLALGVSDIACAGGNNLTLAPSGSIGEHDLINFAPEQPFGPLVSTDPLDKHSPCWLDAEREKGILDAISKHFMLAQKGDGNIGDYAEKEWSKTKVAYAGEILVNTDDCSYVLTAGSGTYKPLGKYLVAANKYFAQVVTDASRHLDIANVCRKP